MSTIFAIFEPDLDGTLHLPLPEELRHGKVKVVAKIEAVEVEPETGFEKLKDFGALRGKILRFGLELNVYVGVGGWGKILEFQFSGVRVSLWHDSQ